MRLRVAPNYEEGNARGISGRPSKSRAEVRVSGGARAVLGEKGVQERFVRRGAAHFGLRLANDFSCGLSQGGGFGQRTARGADDRSVVYKLKI